MTERGRVSRAISPYNDDGAVDDSFRPPSPGRPAVSTCAGKKKKKKKYKRSQRKRCGREEVRAKSTFPERAPIRKGPASRPAVLTGTTLPNGERTRAGRQASCRKSSKAARGGARLPRGKRASPERSGTVAALLSESSVQGSTCLPGVCIPDAGVLSSSPSARHPPPPFLGDAGTHAIMQGSRGKLARERTLS